MKYTNILEKLICVKDIVSNNWTYIAFLSFTALLIILLVTKKISRKTGFITILTSYLCLLGYNIFTYSSELGKIGNSLVDNLFTNIYFPSTYTYLFTLTMIDIITLVSLLNLKGNKVYKIIHGVFFFIIQFILALILELLSKNKIDIFSKTSVFSNKDLVMLLELSMNIFIIWIIVIIFIYITNKITEKILLSNSRKVTEKEFDYTPVDMTTLTANINLTENEESTDNERKPVENLYMSPISTTSTENKQIEETLLNNNVTAENIVTPPAYTNSTFSETIPQPTNIVIPTQPVNTYINTSINTNKITSSNEKENFSINDYIPRQPETIIPEPKTSEVILEKILNNDLPVIQEEKSKSTDNYTLNDYRIFNKMLKEIKEHNQSNTITIDKDLEYRLITKYSTETFNMFKKMLQIYSN